jgi:hypothetical protein
LPSVPSLRTDQGLDRRPFLVVLTSDFNDSHSGDNQ